MRYLIDGKPVSCYEIFDGDEMIHSFNTLDENEHEVARSVDEQTEKLGRKITYKKIELKLMSL